MAPKTATPISRFMETGSRVNVPADAGWVLVLAAAPAVAQSAKASLVNAEGKEVGTAALEQTPQGQGQRRRIGSRLLSCDFLYRHTSL